jgi:hypothetical protein
MALLLIYILLPPPPLHQIITFIEVEVMRIFSLNENQNGKG